MDRLDDDGTASDCLDGVPEDCSLRGALIRANSDGVASTVVLADGIHQLSLPGAEEDLGLTGDLDIVEAQDLMLSASPDTRPVIRQLATDRILEVHSSAGAVHLVGHMTFDGGTAVNSGGLELGGSLYFFRADSLELTDVHFRGGSAADFGGCLYWAAPTTPGSLDLTDVTFDGCQTAGQGAGFFIQSADSTVVLDRITARNGQAGLTGGGGGFFGGATTVVIQRSSFEHNTAASADTSMRGGGLYLGSGSFSIHESAFVRNTVGQAGVNDAYGGGIFLQNSSLLLRNSTLSQNQSVATFDRGTELAAQNSAIGFEFVSLKSREPLVTSSVDLAFDSDLDLFASVIQGSCDRPGTLTSEGFNVDRPVGGAPDTGCNLTHPGDVSTTLDLFATLAGYGGPTPSHPLTTDGENTLLLVSSSSCADTDQRGAERLGLFCYSGAYEANAEAPGKWIFSDNFESGDSTAWSSTGP
ncbi:MAG: right-handed parallel beta-helix repeat-containing protein [Acidobacteriota bacterium]|nr:right-handed parallel beta-helix repeat-containing protein [Acidobacteriota bacterium]